VQQSQYLATNRGRLIGVVDGSPGILTTYEGDRCCVLRVRVEENLFDRKGRLRTVNRKFTVVFLPPLAEWALQNLKEEAEVSIVLRVEMHAPDRRRAELRLVGEGVTATKDGRSLSAKLDVSGDSPVLRQEPPEY
jgi:hypothetical protein